MKRCNHEPLQHQSTLTLQLQSKVDKVAPQKEINLSQIYITKRINLLRTIITTNEKAIKGG